MDATATASTSILVKENPNRFVMFPIKYHDIWKMNKECQSSIWRAEDIKHLEQDLVDWEDKMNSDERHFIKTVLAFFAASDGIVIENLVENFAAEVQLPEARAFYTLQAYMENIHSETYSLLLDTYIKDPVEKQYLFNGISTIDSIKKKGEWSQRWITRSQPLAHRLVAFAVVEGIFFSGSFASIFWLKKRGLMPGLTLSNEWISRDEGMHTEFACLLYTQYIPDSEKDEAIVSKIIRDAVAIEQEFVTESLPCNLIGINSESMKTYIEFVANCISKKLGYGNLYKNVKCPFDFMDNLNLETKANFFERGNTQYTMINEGDSFDFGANMDF